MKPTQDQYNIIDQKTVFKSEKIQIDRASILLPNGNTVQWDAYVLPDMLFAIPIYEGKVIMSKEWRFGPNTYLTQFTAARAISKDTQKNINELRRELSEELGVIGGELKKIATFATGIRITGKTEYYIMEEFDMREPHMDGNEILHHVHIPIKGLYKELITNHAVTSDTLLAAKLIEEKYSDNLPN